MAGAGNAAGRNRRVDLPFDGFIRGSEHFPAQAVPALEDMLWHPDISSCQVHPYRAATWLLLPDVHGLLFAQTNNGSHDLAVKTRALQFRVNFLDIVADGLFSSSRRSMRSMKARNWPTAIVWASLVMSSLTRFLQFKVCKNAGVPRHKTAYRMSGLFFPRVAVKIKCLFRFRLNLAGEALWIAGKVGAQPAKSVREPKWRIS